MDQLDPYVDIIFIRIKLIRINTDDVDPYKPYEST